MSLDPLQALAAQAPSASGAAHATEAGRASIRRQRGRAANRAAGTLLRLFQERDYYGRALEAGKHAVRCPWVDEHSEPRPAEDSDTVIWEANDARAEAFHCSHDHCHGRTAADVYALWLPHPDPEALFAAAGKAQPAERLALLQELAHAVCDHPLEADDWARRVKEAGLTQKGAFLDEIAEARRQLRAEQHDDRSRPLHATALSSGPYRLEHGAICVEKDTRDGRVLVPLCNFEARITDEEVRDDGAETRVLFTLAGSLRTGQLLPPTSVAADRFPGMTWVTPAWGNPAVIYAGAGTKDHLRTAIQLLSGSPPRRTVYEHLGWRKVAGEWVYLHAGGAIGAVGTVGTAQDIEVALDGKLSAYTLPRPPQGGDLVAAVRSSLSLLSVARSDLMYPLLAAVYRAPLAEALSVDCSLFLAGGTGCQKTELSALAQAHFGRDFHGKHLPGNWVSSDNALEKAAFLTKDSLFTVDDFAPGGTSADVQRLHQKADRLIRGQGNKQGRGRMRVDGALRPEYYPRGLVLSSGEDLPGGQSCRARLLILEMARGDVNLAQLTEAQEAAREGSYAAAMAGYLQWLAPQLSALKTTLRSTHEELRQVARRGGVAHDRVPDNVVGLALGLRFFLTFACDAGALTDEQFQDHWAQGWAALLAAGAAQGGHLQNEEPTFRFLALIAAALASGQAHVAHPEAAERPTQPERWGWRRKEYGSGEQWREEWQPQGRCIGWVRGADLFLEPNAAFAVAQGLAQAQGGSLAVSQTTLWKRLAEKRLLAARDERRSRNTVRHILSGVRRDVLHLQSDTLCAETVPTVPAVPTSAAQPRDWDDSVGRITEDRGETVPANRPAIVAERHAAQREGTNGTVGTLTTGVGRVSEALREPSCRHDHEREVIEL